MVACHPAMSSTSGGIVGKKFSFGTGPKPVVEKINKYFNSSKSISRALNRLLDQFEKSAFLYYQPPEQGELVELSKNILFGKEDDDLNSIKNAFTRLSVTLKESESYKRFGNEAPIILLDHMLSPKVPPVMTKTRYMNMLSMDKGVKKRKDASTQPRFRKKDAEHLSLEMCQRLAIPGSLQTTIDPVATMQPGNRNVYRGLFNPNATKLKRKVQHQHQQQQQEQQQQPSHQFDHAKRKKISL